MPFPGDYDDPEFIQQWESFTEQLNINTNNVADIIAQDLLFDGWFNSEVSPDERHEARVEFFEYMEIRDDDFPWDEWVEFYENA